jgi:hypothetical protein
MEYFQELYVEGESLHISSNKLLPESKGQSPIFFQKEDSFNEQPTIYDAHLVCIDSQH